MRKVFISGLVLLSFALIFLAQVFMSYKGANNVAYLYLKGKGINKEVVSVSSTSNTGSKVKWEQNDLGLWQLPNHAKSVIKHITIQTKSNQLKTGLVEIAMAKSHKVHPYNLEFKAYRVNLNAQHTAVINGHTNSLIPNYKQTFNWMGDWELIKWPMLNTLILFFVLVISIYAPIYVIGSKYRAPGPPLFLNWIDGLDVIAKWLMEHMRHLFMALSIMLIAIVFWSLKKGIGFHDESYYLMSMKGIPTLIASKWYLIAEKIYPSDLYQIRLYTVLAKITSALILAFGMKAMYKQQNVFVLFLVALCASFLFKTPVRFVPNYVTMGNMVTFAGAGFLFLAVASGKHSLRLLFAFSSSFVLTFLLFIMITNIPVLFMAGLFVLLMKNDTSKKIELLVAFLIGIAAALAFYFMVFQSYADFTSFVSEKAETAGQSSTHGYENMINWAIGLLRYIAIEITLPTLIIVVLALNKNLSSIVKIALSLLFIVFVSYFLHKHIAADWFNIFTPSPLYILGLALTILAILKKDRKTYLLFLFALSIPVICSFGSDVDFKTRSITFIAPLLILVFVAIQAKHLKMLFLPLSAFILVATFRFIVVYPSTEGWNDYILRNQNKALLNYGHNIQVNSTKAKMLKDVAAVVPRKSHVILSYQNFWGYVYLLDLVTPVVTFRYSPQQIKVAKKNRLKELYLFESSIKPFPEDFFVKNHFEQIDTVLVNGLDHLSIYKVQLSY